MRELWRGFFGELGSCGFFWTIQPPGNRRVLRGGTSDSANGPYALLAFPDCLRHSKTWFTLC